MILTLWDNDKSDCEINVWFDLTYWAIPFCIYWLKVDCTTGFQKAFDFHFLCFGINFEYWRWK